VGLFAFSGTVLQSQLLIAVSVGEMFNNKLFPSEPSYPVIHTRQYQVKAYRISEEKFLLRGVVVDEKPAGLYIENDPDPIWMHHMIVDLEIVYPTFLIEKASVEFKNHPHLSCTNITDHYKKLEGMSIARGFNAKVRELFGSSRGCTHIGALLAAMAPVAIQTGWSMVAGGQLSLSPYRGRGSLDLEACATNSWKTCLSRVLLKGQDWG
jgi:hypothetical protein